MFDRTVFKGIRQLEAGHWLSYRAGRIAIEKYWDLDFGRPRPNGLPRTEGEWGEAIAGKLRESVRIHLRGDVPVAGWLSAGIDSSAVVFLAAEELGGTLPTFSLGFDEPGLDELRHQRTLDQFPGPNLSGERVRFGGGAIEFLSTAIWHQEQPVHLQPSWQALGAAMSGRFKVALTGQGSDEMLGGYPWYKTDRMWTPLYHLPAAVRHAIARMMPRISENDRRAISGPPEMNFQRYSSLHWSRWRELRSLFQPDFQREEALASASLELPAVPGGFREWDRLPAVALHRGEDTTPELYQSGAGRVEHGEFHRAAAAFPRSRVRGALHASSARAAEPSHGKAHPPRGHGTLLAAGDIVEGKTRAQVAGPDLAGGSGRSSGAGPGDARR